MTWLTSSWVEEVVFDVVDELVVEEVVFDVVEELVVEEVVFDVGGRARGGRGRL